MSGTAHGLPSVGVFADCTDRSMPIVELAQELEARGFTGLYLNEHAHLPVSSERSSYPAGGDIPDRYARFWDPFIALSFVAARTSLEVGPTVSLVGEHDAIALAKAIATLDVLSGGRLLLGVGFGWHREEFEDHGLPANVRAKVVEETVELMKRLWCDEVAEYAGTYRRLSPSRSWPKPAQQPHPPVLLGAPASQRNFERIVRWADGWIPMANPILEPSYAEWVAELRRRWEAAGREPDRLQMLALLTTTPTRDLPVAIERATELGVQRVAVRVNESGRDEILPRLDRLQAAVTAVFAS
jgi:probable F420-dependent oxidoreductase